jgi:hypothetical protein
VRPWLFWTIVVFVVLFLAAGIYYACVIRSKTEDTTVAIPPPPPRGQASSDELTTILGQARGLSEELAPTSVRWTRVIAIDDKRAIIAGEVVNETVALFTADAGKTWRSLRSERDAWSNWSMDMDGSLVLGVGSREGAPTAQSAMLEPTKLFFAALDAESLTAPTPLFPTVKGPVKGVLQTEGAIPALISAGSAALIAEESPKKWFVFYGGKPGSDAVAPVKLPGSEKISPVPYGRPPAMLSIKGKDLLWRLFPAAGKPLDKPQKVGGVAVDGALLAELSAPPACETREWSFQRIKQGKRVAVLGVSGNKQVTFLLPENTSPGTRIGCGGGRIAIEAVQPKTGPPAMQASQPDIPTILSCDLTGKCSTPKNAPFRVWPEQHKRDIVMETTEDGVLGVMTIQSGTRWGLYLAQGPGDGTTWERPRPIGEGSGDRGRIELGALVSFGKRAVLLISADVTGTSRRGWFVMASEDGGTNWNPP